MEGEDVETSSWPELLGTNQWKGLLQPLDLSLRRLVLRCGDLCQATYDAFNSDEDSKYCGSSRYGKRDFFHKVSFESPNDYVVSEFLYATSQIDVPGAFLLHSLSREAWSKESNWIGYVTVSSDLIAKASGRREIYVVWRGTIRDLEWIDVLDGKLVSIQPLLKSTIDGDDRHDTPMVMNGWYTIYTSNDPRSPFNKTSARDQLLSKIKELVELYREESLSVICTGHSLGASLAILSAFDIVENGLSKVGDNKIEFPVCAVVFGSPQVGNKTFNDELEKHPNLKVLHVKNGIDLIPHYPSVLLGYAYTGMELVIDTGKSPYLKDSRNPSDWHNLQVILHSVAGWNGRDGEFDLKVKRSVSLVNKSCDYLKEECLIPGSWWVEKNKGMVLGKDGEWHLAAPSEDDIPVPPTQDVDWRQI